VSEVGCGSRFDFTAVYGIGTPEPSRSSKALAGRRALLVESHPRNAEIVARMLEGWEIEVMTARTAASGVTMLEAAVAAQQPFDFVIADMFRGDGGARDLAQTASRLGIDGARIILLTPASHSDVPDLSLPRGVSLMSKPVRESRLFEALSRALHPGASDASQFANPGATLIPHGRRLRILAAEDNATIRRILRAYLEAWGHSVVTATDGTDAVRCCTEASFDLILMDLQMPRMDGIAATASIRQAEKPGTHVPIIALTANVLKGIREDCRAVGMDGYLAKPVRERELLAAIEAAVPGLTAASEMESPCGNLHATSASANIHEPFRVEALLRGVNGSRQTLAGLLTDSKDGDFPELFALLSSALASGDTQGVQRSAHAMKSVLGVFHAPRAYALAQRLEESARLGQAAQLVPQSEELRKAVSELLLSLEQFIADSPLLSQAA
jgi:CheY-like chemotaxis protein